MAQEIRLDGQSPVSPAGRPEDVTSTLDRIPGAWEQMRLGRGQAAHDEVVELYELSRLAAWPPRR